MIPLYTSKRIKKNSLIRFSQTKKNSPLISNIVYSELSNPMLSPNKNILHRINKNQNSICVLHDCSPIKKDNGAQLPFESINSQPLFEIIKTVSPLRIPNKVKVNYDIKNSKKNLNKEDENSLDTKDQLFLKILDEEISEQNMLLKNSKEELNSQSIDKGLKLDMPKIRYVKIDRNSPVAQLNLIKEEFDYNHKELLGHLLFHKNNKKSENFENQNIKITGRRNPICNDYFKTINLTETDEDQNMFGGRNRNYFLNNFSTDFENQHTIKDKIKIENNFLKSIQNNYDKTLIKKPIELRNDPTKFYKRSSDYKVSINNLKSKLNIERNNQIVKNNLLQFKCKESFDEDEFDMNQRIIQIVQSKRNKEVLTKKQLNKKISHLVFAKLVMNDFSIVNKVNEESKPKKKFNFDTIFKYNKIS